MGSLTPVTSTLLPTLQTAVGVASSLNTITNFVKGSSSDALENLQDRQAEDLRRTQENASLERAKIQSDREADDRKRKDALRRAVARQRTQFGGQGISTEGGSGQAILLGLFDENEDQRVERDRLDTLKLNALDQNIAQQKRLNVLQASQLAEKEGIRRLF